MLVCVDLDGTLLDTVPANGASYRAALEELGFTVTDEYYDVDARVKALTAQRDRLLELIGKAASLSELLELEKALADVQGNLDSLTRQLKRYDSQVSMATVTVSLDQIGLTSAAHPARLTTATASSKPTTTATTTKQLRSPTPSWPT